MNAGVAEATSEVVLFLDVRPEIAQGAIQQLVSNFADPNVGCVAGELILSDAGHDATSASISGIYWRYEQWDQEPANQSAILRWESMEASTQFAITLP